MNFYDSDFYAAMGSYHVVDTTNNSVICTLPDTTGWGDDSKTYVFLFKAGASTSLTIVGADGQLINDDESLILDVSSTVRSIQLVTGNGNWYTF